MAWCRKNSEYDRMKVAHSTKWKSSVQPRKQRKYVHNASYHTLGNFLHAHLSKELRQKHGVRAIRVRSGDTVKIMRGSHKGKQGKVESVDVTNARLIVEKIENKKLQGGTASYPVRPSNCVLTELAKDRKRFADTKSKQTSTAAKPTKIESSEPVEAQDSKPVSETKAAPKTK